MCSMRGVPSALMPLSSTPVNGSMANTRSAVLTKRRRASGLTGRVGGGAGGGGGARGFPAPGGQAATSAGGPSGEGARVEVLRLVRVQRVEHVPVGRKDVHATRPAHLFLGDRQLGAAADAADRARFEVERADAVALGRQWWVVGEDKQVLVVVGEGVW